MIAKRRFWKIYQTESGMWRLYHPNDVEVFESFYVERIMVLQKTLNTLDDVKNTVSSKQYPILAL